MFRGRSGKTIQTVKLTMMQGSDSNLSHPQRHKEQAQSAMTAADVVDFYKAMEKMSVKIWVDGGWGVDALLEKQARPHSDLDIVIQQQDVPRFRQYLEDHGYREIK